MAPSASLTRSTAGGIAWSGFGTVFTAGLQLIYTAVMSRLLEPADFGLVAVALVGLRFVTYVSRFGLGSAVTQRVHLTATDTAVALRLALIVGLISATAAAAASPMLAAVVGEPEAAPVMAWLALSLFLGSLTMVPEALLRRELAFRALAGVQIISFGMGYIGVGIAMASAGAGVWSLVGATISQGAIMLAMTMALARPSWRGKFSGRSARELLSFGGAISLTGFLEFLTSNVDTMAVGRWIGAAGLGQYSRATYLVGLPVEQANTATMRVLLPSLSRVQGDLARLARAVTRISGIGACLIVVPMAMVAACANVLVPWVLGPGWEPAARVLPIAAVGYGLALLTNLYGTAAEAAGALGVRLIIQVVALFIAGSTVLAIGIAGPSLHRLAVAFASSEAIRHLLYWIFLFPRLGIARIDIARRYRAAAVIAIAGSTPIAGAVQVLGTESVLGIFTACVVGLLLIGGAWFAVGSDLRMDLSLIRQGARTR